MMLGASGLLEDSTAAGGGGGGGGATIAAAANLKNLEGGDGVSAPAVPDGFEEEERVRGEETDRNFTGNRWPRDETLALLKIRSEMDVAFRDSTLKAPLWDEVSRKLAELGYHRSAKKCKEKFENIYKYHKRTKECRSRRRNGKNYRFFEQLEHLDNQPSSLPSPSQNKIQSSTTETSMEMGLEPRVMMTMADMVIKPSSVTQDVAINPSSIPNSSAELFLMSTSTSATSSSGKESQGISGKKKRKLADYFRSLMNEVLEKQENLQNKFIEALDKCERDRIAREEAWKTQELARIKREQELLAQERDIAAAKDAAVIAFLQKISEQGSPVQFPENQTPTSNPIPIPTSIPIPIPIPNPCEKTNKKQENGVTGENSSQQVSSSRWPKAEVEALIRLRTNLDMQYQDNGAKGPLWEEISSSMKKLGYNRNAKRCKEKWENINKYYKRVKDSNKRRPEDSKTCPYFHILESLYEKKSKKVEFLDSSGSNLKPEQILMQMMGHQQQQEEEQRPESVTEEDGESENVDQNQDDDDDEEEDDDNGDDYQIVVNNNPASVTNME